MLRNYIAAALGNLSRNWLYAGITILGLSVSFAAAILIGLYLRDEVSFDRFVPDHQRIYRMEEILALPGRPPAASDSIPSMMADTLRLNAPQVEQVTRLEMHTVGVRRGDREAIEPIAWADPNFFKLMPMPVLAGDPVAALAAPDGLVLTRQVARRYFGEDAPIGKTLKVTTTLNLQGGGPPGFSDPHVMRVLAVLKDLPESSHISAGVYGSGRAPMSLLALDDAHPSPFSDTSLTYVKLRPGASVDAMQANFHAFTEKRYAGPTGHSPVSFRFTPLADLHFTARPEFDGLRPPGDRTVDAGIGAVGLLIILIAAINFVTLMTARATRRAVEVGVRKAVGARRRDLIAQFMGEAVIYVLISTLIGVSLAELMLPYANALVGRSIRFDYLSDPRLMAAIAGVALATALLAGAYPALVISGFRPASALKGGVGQRAGSAPVRQVLVVVQFAILIGLIVMTATVYRQTTFALTDAVRLNTDQILRINAPCESAMKHQVVALPGVRQLACASQVVVAGGEEHNTAMQLGRQPLTVSMAAVDVGFFEMHGLRPLAGRFFDPNRGQDMVLERMGDGMANQPTLVLNETGARQLGFKSPQDAVGKTVSWSRWTAAGVLRSDRRGPGLHPAVDPQGGRGRDLLRGPGRQPVHGGQAGRPADSRDDEGHRPGLAGDRPRPPAATGIREPSGPGPLQGRHHPGDRHRRLRGAGDPDRLPGPLRSGRLHHRAADQGDRGPQGHGGLDLRCRAPAALAVHQASAVGQPGRLAFGLLGDGPLAARLRLSGGPAAMAVRPGRGRGCPDRLGDGLVPRLAGHPRQARPRPQVRVNGARHAA